MFARLIAAAPALRVTALEIIKAVIISALFLVSVASHANAEDVYKRECASGITDRVVDGIRQCWIYRRESRPIIKARVVALVWMFVVIQSCSFNS